MKYFKNLYIYFITLAVILLITHTNLYSQDFWYPTNGPDGGRILSFADKAGLLFAGTEGAGVFRSSNNGNSWEAINEGIPIGEGTTGYEIYSILTTGTNIFIGTSKEGRIFRSSDDGDNWSQIYASSVLSNITFCLLSTVSGSILAGLDGTGIIRSTDNGDTWNTTSLTTNNIRQMVQAENGDVLAVTNVGVYKTSDDGENWTLSNNGITTTNTYAIHKNSFGTVFCTAGISKVYKSTDNGNNWAEVGSGLPSSIIYCLNSNSSNVMYAGTLFGLYKSTNDGSTWTEDSLDNIVINTLHFNSSDDLIVGTNNEGVFKSQQANSPFVKINDGLKNTYITAMTYGLDSILYVGTYSSGFFKTSNFGNTWIDISEDIIGLSGNSPTVFSLLTHPNGDIIAGTYNQGIFRTTNNGDYWLQEISGFTTYSIYSLAVDKQGNLLAGSTGKLYRSTDFGQNWISIDNNQINDNVNDIAVNSSGDIFAATYGGVFRSTNDGTSWTQVNNGFLYNYAYAVEINDDDDIFVTGEMSGIYKSTNNGDSWSAVLTATLPAYDIVINDLGDIFVSSIQSKGVLRSIDNGTSWQQINSGLYSYNIRCLCLSPNTFLLGGGEGTGVWLSGLPTGSNLFGGNSNLGLPIQYGVPVVNGIIINSNPTPYQSSVSNYLVEKVIVTLQEINHPDISELLVTLEHEGVVDTLVYQPGINGANFLSTKFNDEVSMELSQGTPPFVGSFKPHNPLSVFNSLEATGEWLLTITDEVSANDGTFEAWSISILSDLSSDVENLNEHPSDFYLFQNYPNPFNPSTTISWQSPLGGHQTLKIYDVLGNEVATLVDEYKHAGKHEVSFSSSELTSGIYFYRIQAGSYVETKKMILMK